MKKGYTIFELVVVMALFSIVIMLLWSVLLSSMTMFDRSKENSDLYFQVRYATDYIRNEIRNATEVELLDSVPGVFIAGNEYLYIEDNILQHHTDSGTKEVTKAILEEDTPMFILVLVDSTKSNNVTYTIRGTIDNSKGDRFYDVSTTIHLNNIRNNSTDTGQVIVYKKP